MAYSETGADLLTKRQRYESLHATLWNEKSSFDATWRELADYYFPVRPRFFSPISERNRGERRTQKIIDSTGTFAANTLRSGLHAGLTSPARPWMKLTTPDPSLARFGPVKEWLYDVTERMHQVFQLSNLYNALPLVYGDMGIFGTAAVGILDDPGAVGRPGDLFRCYPYPIGSYALGMDNRGLVTTFDREYVKTIGQLVEEFGGPDGQPLKPRQMPEWSRFSDHVKQQWDQGKYETPVELRWIVTPNRDMDRAKLDYRAFPWTSCHYEKNSSEGKYLRESGFQEFPILAPRWFASSEDTYGTDCPGITALGDVKQLQVQQKRTGQAIEKMVNPPLVAGTDLRTQAVSMIPGGMTYENSREGMKGLRPVYEVKPDISALVFDRQETQGRIREAFLVNFFLMLGQPDPSRGSQPITAEEVRERHEEKLVGLGPTLESTIDELLDPLIDRVYAQLDRAGGIPPPPPELEGVTLTAEYVSILAQARKMLSIAPQERLAAFVAGMAQTHPEVRHKYNVFQAIDDMADALGTNPAEIRPTDEAQQMAQAEQQQAQMAAEAETMQKMAAGAKSLGQTPMDGDTALTRMMEGATAA